jgi:chromate transporter
LRGSAAAGAAIRGANAAVVGVLAVAFYDPVLSGGVASPADGLIAGAAFAALFWRRTPPLAAVALCVAGAVLVDRLRLWA